MARGYDPNLVKISWMHYYFYWFTRDMKEVLIESRKIDCEKLIKEKVKELGCEIRDLSIYSDSVHLGIKSTPILSAHDIITKIRGHTSNKLRRKFSYLRKIPSLWTRSYFVSTFGPEVPNDEMNEYCKWVGDGMKKE